MVRNFFGWAWSKELLANHISGFLNPLYLYTNWVTQCDF